MRWGYELWEWVKGAKKYHEMYRRKIIRAPGSSELYAWLLSTVELAGLSAPFRE
jgi:hypothetical protein